MRKDAPPFPDTIIPTSCLVRILMVTDDEGSFSPEHRFSLTELISALMHETLPFVRFSITTAHRQHETSTYPFPKDAQIKDFRFDNAHHFDPTKYHEIWFFGVANEDFTSQERAPMTERELRIVTQFMEAGGGVFATGDHESLGADLCGRIPRVRSMRRWTFDYSAVKSPHSYDDYREDSGDGPPVLGPFRHDTLRLGHYKDFEFDDQSDDIPAPIIPRRYGRDSPPSAKPGVYFTRSYPHPLLCGPKGVIDVLPDHMHEGNCVIPDDLNQSFTFDGHTSKEYPTVAGFQAIPDVIAEGTILAAHLTRLEKKDLLGGKPGDTRLTDFENAMVIGKTFGAIGAYNGHLVSIGRVVVDSTFHHFFNVNLNGAGSNNLDDPAKQLGFYASPEGLAHYAQIKGYFRNIALWLAPPERQTCMFNHTAWMARWDPQLRMVSTGIKEGAAWRDIVAYGASVGEVLGRIAPKCILLDWILVVAKPLRPFSPWDNPPGPDPIDFAEVLVNPEEVINVGLAGIMSELMRRAPTRTEEFRDTLNQRMPQVITAGFSVALARTVDKIDRRLDQTRQFIETLRSYTEGEPSQTESVE
jgi:hypothetical protein